MTARSPIQRNRYPFRSRNLAPTLAAAQRSISRWSANSFDGRSKSCGVQANAACNHPGNLSASRTMRPRRPPAQSWDGFPIENCHLDSLSRFVVPLLPTTLLRAMAAAADCWFPARAADADGPSGGKGPLSAVGQHFHHLAISVHFRGSYKILY